MASRLFAPASSERVDNSGSLRGSGPRTDESADNEPTKRRSSSLVGDLAASILGADVRRRSSRGRRLGALRAPRREVCPSRDHFGAVGQSPQGESNEVPRCSLGLHAGKCAGGGCVRGSRPGGWAGGRDGSRASGGRPCDGTGGWNGSFSGGEPGGRNGSCAGSGGPDDRRSVAVQLQLSPDGGRRHARPRGAATASGTSGRNRRPSLAGRRSSAALHAAAASRRGGSSGHPDGQKVETA